MHVTSEVSISSGTLRSPSNAPGNPHLFTFQQALFHGTPATENVNQASSLGALRNMDKALLFHWTWAADNVTLYPTVKGGLIYRYLDLQIRSKLTQIR